VDAEFFVSGQVAWLGVVFLGVDEARCIHMAVGWAAGAAAAQ
jgi:hypothetical protein